MELLRPFYLVPHHVTVDVSGSMVVWDEEGFLANVVI